MTQQPAERDSPSTWAHPSTFTSDCRLVEDAIDVYMLEIVDPSQRVVIDRHLVSCHRCSELVKSHRQTVTALALTVPLMSPPASARTALFTRIATTPQSVAPSTSFFSGNLETFRTSTIPASDSTLYQKGPSPSLSNQSAWWRVYAAPLATLPLLLALGLVGAWGFNNYAKLDKANGVIADQSQSLAYMNEQLQVDDQQVVRLAFSPSAKHYNLTSEIASQNSNASGTFVADTATGQALLQVDGLRPGSYSLFVQTEDGTMMQKAEFLVGAEGSATTAVDLGGLVSGFQSVHIRSGNSIIETDVAVDGELQDVLMAIIGPDIDGSSGTGQQGP